MPKEYISVFESYVLEFNYSGLQYIIVPTPFVNPPFSSLLFFFSAERSISFNYSSSDFSDFSVLSPSFSYLIANPKSPSLTSISLFKNIFPGFKSLCIKFLP